MDIKRIKQFIVKELEVHNNECSDSETGTPVRFYLRHRNLSIRKIFQEASSFSKALSMDERVSEICNSQSIGAAIENMTLEAAAQGPWQSVDLQFLFCPERTERLGGR